MWQRGDREGCHCSRGGSKHGKYHGASNRLQIYAGSLVNPKLLDRCRADCRILNSAVMTLEEVIEAIREAEVQGRMTVRLHTGDPSVFGAIREQMDRLDELKIPYDVTPGVSSFCGAAAALRAEYTLPGISQTVILTRMEGQRRTLEI